MIELNVEKFIDVGTVDHRSETPYSIPKSKLTLEYLRDHTYFRARTSMIAAVTRIRHKMCLAAHVFCDKHDIITLTSSQQVIAKVLVKCSKRLPCLTRLNYLKRMEKLIIGKVTLHVKLT